MVQYWCYLLLKNQHHRKYNGLNKIPFKERKKIFTFETQNLTKNNWTNSKQ